MVALSTKATLTVPAVTPSPTSTVRATPLSNGRSTGTISCGLAILMRRIKGKRTEDSRQRTEYPLACPLSAVRCPLASCLLSRDALGRFEREDFAGQILIVGRAGTFGRVGEHRLAEARAFRQLDVPADARFQDLGPRPRHGLP